MSVSAGVVTEYAYGRNGALAFKKDSYADCRCVWKNGYTAFGIPGLSDGALDGLDFEFGGTYTGKEYDGETGLTYYWNRWKSEDGSCFISEDPARDGCNWYGYAGGNPVGFVDPTGLIANCAKQKYEHPAEEFQSSGSGSGLSFPSSVFETNGVAPVAEVKPKAQVGYAAPYNGSWGDYDLLPTFAGINTSSAVLNTTVNGFGVGVYNLLANVVNYSSNCLGIVNDLADMACESVIGMSLDEVTMTMMATGLLLPAGIALEGANFWFGYVRTVNQSRKIQALMKVAQTTVNVGAGLVGVEGNIATSGKGFTSFKGLKSYLGSAGEGIDWHHIVEQSQIEKSGFSPELIHNTNNIIAIDHKTHMKITGFYKTKSFDFTNGLSVRDWLVGQSFEFQYEFGIKTLKDFGVIK